MISSSVPSAPSPRRLFNLLATLYLSFALSANSFALPPLSSYHPLSHRRTNRRKSLDSSTTQDDTISTSSSSSPSTIVAKTDTDDAYAFAPRPLLDARKYRLLTLANGLEVLLVSDPRTDVEASSIHVKCGHFQDPTTRPGLAHFHEHMLFLGTDEYPDPDEYEAYLSKHGGSSNAYTDMEDTNYYFSLNSDAPGALYGALSRLASFFKSPLFSPSMSSREMKAVDSEFANGLQDDSWRQFQLLKHMSNPKHPLHKFGCGNYETLSQGEGPVTDLRKFWEDHYHAGNCKLCVVGREALDELQTHVEQSFGGVRPSPSTFTPYIGAGVPAFISLGVVRELKPVKDRRTVKFSFPVPECKAEGCRESKPHRLISHLLGHEGPGSLHNVLQSEGLVRGLSAGIGVDGVDFSLFTVTVSLTKKGGEGLDRVAELFFMWVKLIQDLWGQDQEKLREYHEEQRKLAEVSFRFSENGDPCGFASSAAEVMWKYDANNVLTTGLVGDFDPVLFDRYLNSFNPSNCVVTVISPSLDTSTDNSPSAKKMTASSVKWDVEPIYNNTFRQAPIRKEVVKELREKDPDPQLQLPSLNPFVPKDFDLILPSGSRTAPESVAFAPSLSPSPPPVPTRKPGVDLYYKNTVNDYAIPKCVFYAHLTSPSCYSSPRSMTLSRAFERALRESLNADAYDASVAGCNFSVNCHPSGFRIVVSGWSGAAAPLLERVVERIRGLIEEMAGHDGQEDTPLFRSFKTQVEGLRIETENFELDPPYELANYNSRLLMEENVWTVEQYLDEIPGLTMKDCGELVKGCFEGVAVNALCMGSVDLEGTEEMVKTVESVASPTLKPGNFPRFRSLQLPKGDPIVYQAIASEYESNHAVEYNLQAGCETDLGFEGIAILELICHLAYTSAYNQLRTREQLGYIVSAFFRKTQGGGVGLGVTVQSNAKSPPELQGRIEEWLALFRKELEDMDEAEVEAEGSAVVAQLTEKDMKLSHSVGRAWAEISLTELQPDTAPCWDRLERIADGIRNSENLKKELLEKWDEWFVRDRRVISSWVWSGTEGKKGFADWEGKPNFLSSREEVMAQKAKMKPFAVI